MVGLLESLLTANLVDEITDTHSRKGREARAQGEMEREHDNCHDQRMTTIAEPPPHVFVIKGDTRNFACDAFMWASVRTERPVGRRLEERWTERRSTLRGVDKG